MKKGLCALLCLLMVLSCAGALAEDDYLVFVQPTANAQRVQIDSDNAADVLGDGTVRYNAAAHTLTIRNANLAGITFGYYGEDQDTAYTLVLEGENKLNVPAQDEAMWNILSENDLTITGEGALVMSNKSYDVMQWEGGDTFKMGMPCLEVRGDLLLNGVTVTADSYNDMGNTIYVEEAEFEIRNSDVTVTSGDDGYGIWCGKLLISGASVVKATTGKEKMWGSCAIGADEGIVIGNGATVEALGATYAMEPFTLKNYSNAAILAGESAAKATAVSKDADVYEYKYVKIYPNIETRVEKTTIEAALAGSIPPALKEIGMDTAAEITGALNKAAAGKGYDAKNSVTMDVQLQMKTVGDDGKEKWVTVTEENFPAEGVEVAFDLPAGTNATDYEFVIAHMLTTGKNAGKVELLTPTVKDGKLVAKFTSLSPVSISWKTTLKPSTLPKTGDASNIALWMMLLTVTAAAVICLKRKTVNS